MTKFAVAILLLALTMPARADSANEMLSKCKGSVGDEMMWHCIGVVEGVAYTGYFTKLFCPPSETKLRQMVIVVKTYIEARPQRMDEDFGELAIEAMQAAWPCKR
jgi:Rap1a immunity proteins